MLRNQPRRHQQSTVDDKVHALTGCLVVDAIRNLQLIMVSLHPNGVTIVAHHPIEWYEENGWKHSLNGVEYRIVRSRNELKECIQAVFAPERLVTTFVKSMENLFFLSNISNVNLSGWDTANVTNMSNMFYDAKAFNGDLSAWDTSNVTDMNHMFSEAEVFNGDLSAWDTSKVTDMNHMFYGAHAFNGDLSKWDTSNVTNMSGMFNEAHSFNGDVSAWDTSNVLKTNMGMMFVGSGVRRIVPWCPGSKIMADENTWMSRRGAVFYWRWALDCHRDARHCEWAARAGRPMELEKRLRKGVRAGGIEFAESGCRGKKEDGEVRAAIQSAVRPPFWE
jgi:surface protein